MFTDFAAVERHLNSLINYEHDFPLGGKRDRPKLEPTRRAALRLALPLNLPDCVHIAGTKGKGSTAALLEALLDGPHGVLSFTSPHLVSVRERVRLNGEPLPDALWREGFSAIVPRLRESPPIELTYFESVFVFCLWTSVRLQTRFHVVEAGLGGLWDVTNLLAGPLAVLTPVDFDHTEVLGNTLTEIARDKGGIIKPDSVVIIGPQPPEVQSVYAAIAAGQAAHVYSAQRDFRWDASGDETFTYSEHEFSVSGLRLRPPGVHQRDNAAMAVCAARRLWPELTADEIRARLENCEIPGRQQLLPGTPPVLLDVAHNPVSFRALADTLRVMHAKRRVCAVIGMRNNKDARASLLPLREHVATIYPVAIRHPNSYRPDELAAVAAELGMHASVLPSTAESFAALHRSDADMGLVAGSFYLAGEYLEWRQRAGIA